MGIDAKAGSTALLIPRQQHARMVRVVGGRGKETTIPRVHSLLVRIPIKRYSKPLMGNAETVSRAVKSMPI
jgi:uncharacterized protein YqfA (UPF0365 family)